MMHCRTISGKNVGQRLYSFRKYKVYADIQGVLGVGASNDSGVIDDGKFRRFWCLLFKGNFRTRFSRQHFRLKVFDVQFAVQFAVFCYVYVVVQQLWRSVNCGIN